MIFKGLIKIDTVEKIDSVWLGEPYEYLGESIFVANEKGIEEDDGYVLSILTNGKDNTSEFVIFDAKDVSKGPISRLNIKGTNIPFGLHGSWAQGLVFSEEDIIRKWKASYALDSKSWNEVKSDFSGLGLVYDF